MADCQFVAFHGWAFDRKFWKPWSRKLSEYGTFQASDRGYFGDPHKVSLDNEGGPVILITHSLGLHFIDKPMFEQADLLIITGGFLYFHPYAAQYKRRSRLVVQEMMNELEVNPEKVLHRFYQNSYAPEPIPNIAFTDIHIELLLNDLRLLQESEMDVEWLKKANKVCILHGSDDQIVPYKKGRQIYNQLQEYSQYFEIKNAGHALPYTHTRQCLEFVIPEIEQWADT